MKQSIKVALFIIFQFALWFPFASVQAIPVLPSSYYGLVKQNDKNVKEGTLVEALVNNQVFATGNVRLYQGDSVFALDVRGDDSDTAAVDGGREGDAVQFRVGGALAAETGVWHSGTNTAINLTLSGATALDEPQPTQAPPPTQTAIVVDRPTATIPVSPTPRPTQTPAASAPTAEPSAAEAATAIPTAAIGPLLPTNDGALALAGNSAAEPPAAAQPEPNQPATAPVAASTGGLRPAGFILLGVLALSGVLGGLWFLKRK